MKKIYIILIIFLVLALWSGCKVEKQSTTQSKQISVKFSKIKTSSLQPPVTAAKTPSTRRTQLSPVIVTSTQSAIIQNSPKTSSEISQIPSKTASSEGDTGDDTPLEWPTELMGDILPVPNGAITSIDKANQIWDKDEPDYIIVVSLKNMSKDDCILYINKLKKLGFADGVSEQTDKKISFSGGIDNLGIGVSFSYDFIKNKGFVAYNPKLNASNVDK